MNISIGVMAYNEEKNIGNILEALLNQKTKNVNIKEIVVVSSGSTDDTNKIVKDFSKKSKKIKLITQKERKGKASAINEFLKKSKCHILVLESADTIPEKDAIENLCKPLNEEKIGVVASHPIPRIHKKDFLGFLVNLQWILHHKINLSNNHKFGEMIAFRKAFDKIGRTAVDEEYIAMLIKRKEYMSFYAEDAVVYNFGPKTITDFLRQRRRIYCGHFELKKRYKYEIATIKNYKILNMLISELRFNDIFLNFFAMILEIFGRLLGIYDYYTNKRHYIWDVAKSAK